MRYFNRSHVRPSLLRRLIWDRRRHAAPASGCCAPELYRRSSAESCGTRNLAHQDRRATAIGDGIGRCTASASAPASRRRLVGNLVRVTVMQLSVIGHHPAGAAHDSTPPWRPDHCQACQRHPEGSATSALAGAGGHQAAPLTWGARLPGLQALLRLCRRRVDEHSTVGGGTPRRCSSPGPMSRCNRSTSSGWCCSSSVKPCSADPCLSAIVSPRWVIDRCGSSTTVPPSSAIAI